ncbi:hypothetical protein JM946_00125 [Steroidobacter sp. S1-65]|uniref:DUF3617 family protein n=1 Tax=Steroidobacter gossypii TaxID=2805490 RepID=A0ABS1WQ73_9GAMM|nr:hypothetical protein [Steroidobacter gossypii]MBM0103125.1 hypothetical protein [Steroidobacter gossypii]
MVDVDDFVIRAGHVGIHDGKRHLIRRAFHQMMTPKALLVLFLAGAPLLAADAGPKRKDRLCGELSSFLASVKPEVSRSFTLYTFWGAEVEGDQIVMGAKRCEHNDYEPGKKLCAYLVENSSTEFAGYNVKRVLNCLLPGRGVPGELEIKNGSFSVTYGSPNRGALVDIVLSRDEQFDGMAFRLTADGY